MMDSVVECQTCGRKMHVSFAGCTFGNGWPKCCGYTMRLISSPHGKELKDALEREFWRNLAPVAGHSGNW